ncbi:Uncharacterized protein FKW44_000346, partial [Caligus rogercresseyi]
CRNTQRVINYLRRAIQAPCGFDRLDYTLCCRDSNSVPTPATTTTTTTTTTRSTTTPSSGNGALQICGISGFKTRVTGGQVATPGVWPWAVILGQRSSDGIEVISHCFRGQKAINLVRLGEHDISTSTDGATPQDIPVARILTHSGYNGVDLKNDIAVVTLSSPAVFSTRVRPACLPGPNDRLPSNEAVIL